MEHEHNNPGAQVPAGSFVTTTKLLEGLSDAQNREAWEGFVERYRPVVMGYGRKLGVSAADQEDVAQQVLAEFARGFASGAYQRGRGRLRAWLFGIARNQVRLWRRKNLGRGAGELVVEPESDDDALQEAWDREWQEHVLRRSMLLLREVVTEQTLEAFIMFALDGVPAEVVAGRLGMTQNAVFGAKRRVLERLKDLRDQIERDE